MIRRVCLACALIFAWIPVVAYAAEVPFEAERWVIQAAEHRFEEHLDRPSLFLRNGLAWVRDSELTDGVIEFDIAFTRRTRVHGLRLAHPGRGELRGVLRPPAPGRQA